MTAALSPRPWLCVTVIGLRHRNVNGNGKKRKEKGARAGPIHGPMIAMIKKDDDQVGQQ
jgi:hypothetical protein